MSKITSSYNPIHNDWKGCLASNVAYLRDVRALKHPARDHIAEVEYSVFTLLDRPGKFKGFYIHESYRD